MKPNETQLQCLFEVLQYRLPQQWKARFIDTLPGGELIDIFERGQTPNGFTGIPFTQMVSF